MLKQGGGSIVNISSGAASVRIRGLMAYCVAKAALEHLTRCMANELAPKIRVNAIALGSIMTDALRHTIDQQPGFEDKMKELTPLHRIGEVEDIGLATLYFCSKGCYATGAILAVDGGLEQTNLPFKLPDL